MSFSCSSQACSQYQYCTTVHERLAFDAGLLHRDINPSNLLYNESDNDRPYLIDLDFAVRIEAPSSDASNPNSDPLKPKSDEPQHPYALKSSPNVTEYSFALPFIALDHLHRMAHKGIDIAFHQVWASSHMYRHDLESFVWSMWWIVIGAHPTKGAQELNRRCSMWKSLKLDDNQNAKFHFITDEDDKLIEEIAYYSRILCTGENRGVRDTFSTFLKNISRVIGGGYQDMQKMKRANASTKLSIRSYETACGRIKIGELLAAFPQSVKDRFEQDSDVHMMQ